MLRGHPSGCIPNPGFWQKATLFEPGLGEAVCCLLVDLGDTESHFLRTKVDTWMGLL